jgi:hypothetical protein
MLTAETVLFNKLRVSLNLRDSEKAILLAHLV